MTQYAFCRNRSVVDTSVLNRLGYFAGRWSIVLAAAAALAGTASPAHAQSLTLAQDTVVDNQALLMPLSAPYGRAINGVSFQSEALMTRGKYQYTTWYHLGANNEDVYLARRDLSTNGAWQVIDTGKNFDNGDAPAWDAHNVISLGIDGNGKMHLSWDLHQQNLRYMTTGDGAATGAAWAASLFGAETKTLPGSGIAAAATPFNEVTYPQFVTKANGDMIMAFRNHNSGNGDMYMATYSAATKTWDAPHEIIDGTHSGLSYNDPYGNGSASTLRNGYINGIDVDTNGRLQMTWTWRESSGGSNHDINYAYSDDNGATWRNNVGAVVGTPASPMNLNSPGIVVKSLDRGNTLMNQQAQAVDSHGTLHTVMWHKADDQAPVSGFTTTPAAYYDYYRGSDGTWHRNTLPLERAVGSRADIGFDKDDSLYAAYISAGPGDGANMLNYYTDGDLVIAKATAAGGYADWKIVFVDSSRNWIGEPRLDQARLLKDGVLSIFLQESSTNANAVGTPLHVLEFNVPEPATGAILLIPGLLLRRRR